MNKRNITEQRNRRIQQHFARMVNEGYLSTSLEEAEDDDNDNNQPGGAPDMGGGMPPMGGQQPGGPGQDAGGMNPGGGPDAGGPGGMPQIDNQQGGGNAQGPDFGNGGDNMPDLGGQDGGMGGDMPDFGDDDLDDEVEDDDDVLDLDDLTDAQEKLNTKQNSLGKDFGQLDGRIEKLLSAVETMKDTIDHNNADITALKAELQKRVPTNTERLNMRSLDSYPFNVNPVDYWKRKEAEGIYSTGSDEVDKPKEYTITKDDVDNYNDSEIANSLDPNLRQTMKDIFKGF
jgi:hypothetical protein